MLNPEPGSGMSLNMALTYKQRWPYTKTPGPDQVSDRRSWEKMNAQKLANQVEASDIQGQDYLDLGFSFR